MWKKLRVRFRSREGFTIGEMLVAVLILMMVSAVVGAGIPVAANAYYKVVDAANAQMLLSTTLTRLRTELSTATEIEVTGTTISYRSGAGGKSELRVVENKTPSSTQSAVKGGIYLRKGVKTNDAGTGESTSQQPGESTSQQPGESTSQQPGDLLVSEAASSGLYMKYTGVSYDKTTGVVTFTGLAVMKDDNKALTTLDTYKVRVLTRAAT